VAAPVSHDPFTAPSSNVDMPDTARGSAVKAVVLGLMTDIGGSMCRASPSSCSMAPTLARPVARPTIS
jgi:hypothetical protein